MCRFIFGFVLLSASVDFTVCTLTTHPRSPAWHRRLRKRRQLARRRLRQHCATPADCWRIATSRILPPWTNDLVMPGVRNGEPRQSTEVHDSGLSASWRASIGARARRRLRPVDDARAPIVPTIIMLGEVIATVAVTPSAWWDVALVVVVAVLQGSRLSERLSEISFRRSAKGCVAATLSARRRWQSRIRVQPGPRSKTA